MTTPTPNARDAQIASQIAAWHTSDGRSYADPITIIASYRQEIEARKECEIDNMHRAFNDAVEQRDANRRRISTLQSALEKAVEALTTGHTSNCSIQSPDEPFCDCGYGQFYEEALAAIREALLPTSPPSTSNPPSDPAAAP